MIESSHNQTSEMKPRQKWSNEARTKMMEFQIYKTKIKAHSAFSIERFQRF